MNAVIHYFQTLEQHPLQRMLFLLSGMIFLWLMEGMVPLIKMQYKKNKIHHAAVNFAFTIVHLILHTFFALLIIAPLPLRNE